MDECCGQDRGGCILGRGNSMNRRQRLCANVGLAESSLYAEFCMSQEKRRQVMTVWGAEIMSRRTQHAL